MVNTTRRAGLLAVAMSACAGIPSQQIPAHPPPVESPVRAGCVPITLAALDAARGPRPDDAKCLSVRIPRQFSVGLEGPFVLKWAVCRDGSVGNITLSGKSDDPQLIDALRRALRETVQRCRWIPGTDSDGNPIDVWVERTFRFSG